MRSVSAVLGIVVARTEALRSRAGSDADRPADQNSFAEAHLAVVDGQVSHTAHVGLPGGDAVRQENICEEDECSTPLESCEVCVGGEKQKCPAVSPGAPPMNTGFLVSVALGFKGPTTWLTSESTASWTMLASRITEAKQDRMHQFSQEALQNPSSGCGDDLLMILHFRIL